MKQLLIFQILTFFANEDHVKALFDNDFELQNLPNETVNANMSEKENVNCSTTKYF